MKKIIVRKENRLYIKKDVQAVYCDFCGENNVTAFESEYADDPNTCGKIEMQICYGCVEQLAKFLNSPVKKR